MDNGVHWLLRRAPDATKEGCRELGVGSASGGRGTAWAREGAERGDSEAPRGGVHVFGASGGSCNRQAAEQNANSVLISAGRVLDSLHACFATRASPTTSRNERLAGEPLADACERTV